MTSHMCLYGSTLIQSEERTIKLSMLIPNKNEEEFISVEEKERYISILRDSITVRLDLSKVSETKGDQKSTQKDHLDKLIQISNGLITSTVAKANYNLSNYKCDIGFASGTSVPDGINIVDGIARGIIEIKDNTSTPAEATRHGISEAFNLAIAQLKLNINYMDVMIPIIGSNGYLIEFSCLVLLKPSFPLIVKLSKVLDLTDDSDLFVAARYFKNINRFYEISLHTEESPSMIPNTYI